MLFNDLYHPKAVIASLEHAQAAKAMRLDLEELRVRRTAAAALAAVTHDPVVRATAALEEMRLAFQISMLRKRMKDVRFDPHSEAPEAAR